MTFFLVGVIILALFAVFDLMVGVSNDAVNFLNSSIGSRVASRKVIFIVASLGILAGVTFSGGMMEVARKGIFHPSFFTMPELLAIFLAVMIADVILLDLFNTFGLPTSTTVSIVFELLGAAVAISLIKIFAAGDGIATLGKYINSAKAMLIIFGILLSVVVAFFAGALAQFISRLIFTFDSAKRITRYGAIWGGFALSAITYFILVKGSKGATFMTADTIQYIKGHTLEILGISLVCSAIVLQILMSAFKVNILKPIVLIGTFALAMAFAANDLVNFIGVPLAGFHAYKAALLASNPLDVTMGALSRKVPLQTSLLLIAGLIMVLTLWFSKKSRTVTETEVGLGQQDSGDEKFESLALARVVVRQSYNFFSIAKLIIPPPIRKFIHRRVDPENFKIEKNKDDAIAFDLIRASVNLMVASAVVSFATSMRLPLSTTYVTFMVAMGTSFSDQAWGRESASYRVSGVMTVIGGWFMTALMAFSIAFIFANVIHFSHGYGVLLLLFIAAFAIWRTNKKHRSKIEEGQELAIFNLRKIQDGPGSLKMTYNHIGVFVSEIRKNLDRTLTSLFEEDLSKLRTSKKARSQIQRWSNIITANIFKVMRLEKVGNQEAKPHYAFTTRSLQKVVDAYRDIVVRCYSHISNNHEGLLKEQIKDLNRVRNFLYSILTEVELGLTGRKEINLNLVVEYNAKLDQLALDLDKKQVTRILDESSKTRLSILFYSILGDIMTISRENIKLLENFDTAFKS